MEKSNKGKSVWEMEQEIGKKFPWFIDPDAWSNDGCATPEDERMMKKEFGHLFKDDSPSDSKNKK